MISILMATFNGEKYIREQLDSLLAQTCQDFLLYICDDCSTDSTFTILEEYKKKYPEKIKISKNEKNSGNAKHNFIRIMIDVKDDYVMLCDQDDVWMPRKIEITLGKMKAMEKEWGKDMPILVHTDLKVVDEKLNTISLSYAKYMNADYSKIFLHKQVIQNTLTGCTAMYNRALAKLITVEPEYMVMHDWYLMLVASAFGKIGTVMKPTIYYRQHTKNVVGTRNMRSFSGIWSRFMDGEGIKQAIQVTYFQANAFLKVYENKLTKKQVDFLQAYIEISQKGKLGRIFSMIRLRTFKNGFMRNLGYLIYI